MIGPPPPRPPPIFQNGQKDVEISYRNTPTSVSAWVGGEWVEAGIWAELGKNGRQSLFMHIR